LQVIEELYQSAFTPAGKSRTIFPGNTKTPFPLPAEPNPPGSQSPRPRPTTTLPAADPTTFGTETKSTTRVTAGETVSGLVGNEIGLPINRENLGLLAGPINTAINLGTNTAAKLPLKKLVVDIGLSYLGVGIDKTKIPNRLERFAYSFPALFLFGELITPPNAFTLNDETPTPTPGGAALTTQELGALVLAGFVPNNPPDPKDRQPTPPMWMADP
jgi:hypothetical protein